MPLPILESPKYVLSIPSTGKSIEYRPFLVKEEKILLLAQEANNQIEMISAIKDIINACTFGIIDVNDLTSFDLEYIFLKLRAKSVGEISNVRCKCEKCEAHNEISINIDEIKIVWPENKIDNKIMLTDTVGVILRYIKIDDVSSIVNAANEINIDTITDMIIASIESIFDEKGVYKTNQTSKEELLSFVNSLNRSQIEKIENYIASAPKLQHSVNFTCNSCKNVNDITLSGIQAFFE